MGDTASCQQRAQVGTHWLAKESNLFASLRQFILRDAASEFTFLGVEVAYVW